MHFDVYWEKESLSKACEGEKKKKLQSFLYQERLEFSDFISLKILCSFQSSKDPH